MKPALNKVFILSLIWIIMSSFASAQAKIPILKNKFVVISHRGNHVAVPENTIPAIQKAIDVGADFVEIDLRTTSDSALVLMHDGTVDRMTNGKGKVSDLTYSEINAIKVKPRLTSDSSKYSIPTFEEVLRVCKDKINIYLDFKNADIKQTLALIDKFKMRKNIIVYPNSIKHYKDWRLFAPDIPIISNLPKSVTDSTGLVAFLKNSPIEVFDEATNPNFVDIIHKNGSKIFMDVQKPVETEEYWFEMLKKNVEGFQTDAPENLINFLKKNGLR